LAKSFTNKIVEANYKDVEIFFETFEGAMPRTILP